MGDVGETATAVPVVPPEPRAGQRWRWMHEPNDGEIFTLATHPRHPEQFQLMVDGETGGVPFTVDEIRDGAAFVDHGEPACECNLPCGHAESHGCGACGKTCPGLRPRAQAASPAPAPDVAKPKRVKTSTYCGISIPDCPKLETTGPDLDGYRYCEEHRHHGRFQGAAPIPEAPWIAQGQGSDVPEAPKPKAPTQIVGPEGKAAACGAPPQTGSAPAVTAPKPALLREVSSNGREWIKYDTLVDADPFTSYRWHRERVTMSDGTWTETAKQPTEPRGYNGTWANHTFLDRERRMVMDKRDDEGRPDRDSPPPSHPLQREARVTLFGGVWNLRGGR